MLPAAAPSKVRQTIHRGHHLRISTPIHDSITNTDSLFTSGIPLACPTPPNTPNLLASAKTSYLTPAMASTRHTTAYAGYTLLLLAMSSTVWGQDLSEMTYKGCYSSSQPLTNHGSWKYQTSGYCQPICVKANQAVLGLTNGEECWCGDLLPAASSKVDDSKCNDPCDGFDKEMCMYRPELRQM